MKGKSIMKTVLIIITFLLLLNIMTCAGTGQDHRTDKIPGKTKTSQFCCNP